MPQGRRIYAIRHGQSVFNVLYESPPSDEERYHQRMKKIDCDITPLGVDQSLNAGKELTELLDPRPLDCMVISPLRRALQTAQHVLRAYREENPPTLKISKLCSEVLLDACDIGSTPIQLAQEFPEWDFSHLEQFWWHAAWTPKKRGSSCNKRKFKRRNMK